MSWQKSALERLFKYVQIESETGNEKAVGEAVKADLKAMGLLPQEDHAGRLCGSTGNNIYCHIDGEPGAEPLMLEAHLDTVSPGSGIEPYVDGEWVKSRGNTILGADDKAGVAAILEAVSRILSQRLKHRPLDLVFSICEEAGRSGARHIDLSRIRARKAVVLDGGENIGRIIAQAPGMNTITAEIRGRAAHAWVEPEKGVSAIAAAARAVAEMELFPIDPETTANVGSFEAFGQTSVICDRAKLTFEVRSKSREKLAEHTGRILNCLQRAADETGAELIYKLHNDCPAFCLPQDRGTAKMVEDMCIRHGLAHCFTKEGGASNANIYNEMGIETVSVGIGMERVHTPQERLKLDWFYECIQGIVWLATEKLEDI